MKATAATRTCRKQPPKALLFCGHPVAQQEFARLLQRAELQVATLDPHLLLARAAALTSAHAQLAVVDGSDLSLASQCVRAIRVADPALPLLAVMPALEDIVTFPLLRLGVKGLVTYEQAPRELSRAATQVATGAYWVPRELLTRFVEAILPELPGCKSLELEGSISRREREVLDLLLENLSNKEIAARTFISERTVKFHVSNLLMKFGVQRRADLIVLWMQRNHGLPSAPRTESLAFRLVTS